MFLGGGRNSLTTSNTWEKRHGVSVCPCVSVCLCVSVCDCVRLCASVRLCEETVPTYCSWSLPSSYTLLLSARALLATKWTVPVNLPPLLYHRLVRVLLAYVTQIMTITEHTYISVMLAINWAHVYVWVWVVVLSRHVWCLSYITYTYIHMCDACHYIYLFVYIYILYIYIICTPERMGESVRELAGFP